MERLLSYGYSSVHTRVGFDIAMFRPKSKEYLVQNDKIVDDLRNIYGEPDEKSQRKVLMQNLIDLWKNEDRKNPHKIIYNLCFDGEEQSQPRRAFSKICKLDENNQYGFAMTKPLPIGIFKKKPFVDLDILNKAVNDFDPTSKTGHVFVVDIHFQEFNDPKKKKDVQ